MTRGRGLRIGALVGAATVLLVGCGSGEDNRPPPTIGDATVIERPEGDAATTTATTP